MTGETEPLIVLVRFFFVEDFDDFLAVAANHHGVVLRVHMYRSSTALEEFRTIILSFHHGGKVRSLRAQIVVF